MESMKAPAIGEGSKIAGTRAPRETNSTQSTLLQHTAMSNEDNRPATKKDLSELRTELNGNVAQLRTELNGKMDRLREELVEQMRDMQTEVLRAFHGWASPIEIRLRALPNMEERLVLLEERVSAIERRDKRN
jgi:uncharacterized coiled-coil protein SlyX